MNNGEYLLCFWSSYFLLALYFIFAYISKKMTIHYLGVILLIIAGFMMLFNLQTWQQASLKWIKPLQKLFSEKIGYPSLLLVF